MYFDSSSLDNAMIYRSTRITAWCGGSRAARDRAGRRVEESKERKKLEEGSNLGHCLSVISIEFYCWMIELRF
ncbi:hypothetical protein Peur_019699 [Populus x canadensis]